MAGFFKYILIISASVVIFQETTNVKYFAQAMENGHCESPNTVCGKKTMERLTDLEASNARLKQLLAGALLSAQELRRANVELLQVNLELRQTNVELRQNILLKTNHSALERRIEEVEGRIKALEEGKEMRLGGVPHAQVPVPHPTSVTPPSPATVPEPSPSPTIFTEPVDPKVELGKQLIQAGREGKDEDVKSLLEQGADVNYVDKSGYTALLWAVRKKHLKVTKLLLEAEAAVDTANDYRHTPLHLISINGDEAIGLVLLGKGADVNVRNVDDFTPLHYAALHGHLPIVRILLLHGADPKAKDRDGKTPYDYADSDEIRALLS